MKLQTKSGFTLIESLVAITILIIGVLGPMMAATRGITDGLYAQNQLIATHLTQEALELASIQIEDNKVKDVLFLDGLDQCTSSNGGCAVVINPNDVSFSFGLCAGATNSCKMTYDSATGFYKYGNGTGPVFTRILTVTELESEKQALLEAKVTWVNKTGAAEKNVTLYRYVFKL